MPEIEEDETKPGDVVSIPLSVFVKSVYPSAHGDDRGIVLEGPTEDFSLYFVVSPRSPSCLSKEDFKRIGPATTEELLLSVNERIRALGLEQIQKAINA